MVTVKGWLFRWHNTEILQLIRNILTAPADLGPRTTTLLSAIYVVDQLLDPPLPGSSFIIDKERSKTFNKIWGFTRTKNDLTNRVVVNMTRDVPMGGVGGGVAPPKPNSVGKFGLVWTFFRQIEPCRWGPPANFASSWMPDIARRQIWPFQMCASANLALTEMPVGKSCSVIDARRQI